MSCRMNGVSNDYNIFNIRDLYSLINIIFNQNNLSSVKVTLVVR